MPIRTIVLFALQAALTLLILVVCWTGIHGSFLFDDFANLPALGATGPIDNLDSLWRYVTSGTADPTGRPLVLLSFLIDARDWPANPLPFKRTNLFLHVATALLLIHLLRQLGRELAWYPTKALRIECAAVLAAALWALHPLWISTTFYVVQREAMLPAFFSLMGLVLWLRGRRAFTRGRTFAGTLWLAFGLWGCTLLATLSKANGVLLPALALTIEFSWLRVMVLVRPPAARSPSPAYSRAMWVLAGIPTALVACYLIYQGWHGITHGIPNARPWTLTQRLLTEPRVLFEYLRLLWLPTPFTPGLFNDQISASTSLLSPITTGFSLLGIIALISSAIMFRRHSPAAALAVLFFFVAQVIESSSIPLELYFEHRNYLPALLMFWPLALWICGVPGAMSQSPQDQVSLDDSPHFSYLLKTVLAVVAVSGLALMTHARASLWGNVHDQALLWARLNPGSPRAQVNAAQVEAKSGHLAQADRRLDAALRLAPGELQVALNLVSVRCQLGRLDNATINVATGALRTTANPGALLANWFDRAINESLHAPCPQLDLDLVQRMIDAALANPKLSAEAGRRQDLYYLKGRIALVRNEPRQALENFNRALDQQVRPTAAFQQAALLGSSGYPSEGLAHLEHFQLERGKEYVPTFGMPWVHAWILRRQHYWDTEMSRLRTTLAADLQAEERG